MERLPSRGQTVRFPRLSRYSRGLLRSPRPSAGLRSLARDPLASAGSLTPSGERLKAPAAPGLFRVDREITVKGSKCQGWSTPPQASGWAYASRHKFPHRLFFCGCRLSAAAAGSHPPPAAAKSTVPTAKSTVAAGFGWSGSSSGGSKIHRCRRRSAGRVRGLQQQRRQKGVQLVGQQPPAAKSTAAARCSAGRAP